MNDNPSQRTLKAVLIADVNNYSKLMANDDEYTVKTISDYREIIGELIKKHQGRVVDSPGDNILAEFGSALSAVNGAIEIQTTLKDENQQLPLSHRMSFRMGISLGDIIQKNGRIYGDGVNIAARIQSFAEPGGICISRGIYDQVKKRIGFIVKDLGPHSMKNLPDPISIYRICLATEIDKKKVRRFHLHPGRKLIFISIACFLVPGIILMWVLKQGVPEYKTAFIKKETARPFSVEKSIAVLPFVNLSGDSGQNFLCCGIPEQIITFLLNIPFIFVVAAYDPSFAHGGSEGNKLPDIEESGARYLLEGSVQCLNKRVRITSRLLDLTTRHYVWANTFDREPKDMFALQDEIAMDIIAMLKEKLFLSRDSADDQHVETNEADLLFSEDGIVIE